MNYLRSFKSLSRAKKLGALLLVAVATWTIGIPSFFTTASAAQVSQFSATASSSVPSVSTNYTIQYTATTSLSTGQTIKIIFNPLDVGSNFDLSTLTVNDLLTSGSPTNLTIITAACGAVTADQVSISGGISNAAGDRSVTLVACGAISTGTKTLRFINSHIINPAAAGASYIIRLGGTQTDKGDTRVAIVNQVTVTASVDTTLTFTVAGVATGGFINGELISTTSQATSIGFGVLASGTPVLAAHDLSVTTNAQNGFVVTVHEDQNLLSSNGADIDLFSNGSALAIPGAWATPTAVLGSENTYGHIGLTSNDTDLNANEFFSGSAVKWAGNFYSTTTRPIFSHTGPADGTTQNVGVARVGYKVLVSSLQEAATDYTNHLIYICTPTF